MKSSEAPFPDWELLLAHAAELQTKIPGAVLVGGTAAAVHAKHRYSIDHDHVIAKLGVNYEKALKALESIAGWRTERRVRGKLVLGKRSGIAAGLRNLRRSAPLETTTIKLGRGRQILVPTPAEMLRIKAFLTIERNATRDYLDVAALSDHIGVKKSIAALNRMNDLYREFASDGGDVVTRIVVKLTSPDPYDLTDVDLTEYKGITKPWSNWRAVEKQCHKLAVALVK